MTDQDYVEAIEAIYSAAHSPDAWPVALTSISKYCGGCCANLFYIREDGGYGMISSTNFPPGALEEYIEKWWQHDLRSHRGLAQEYSHWRNAQCDHDLLTEEEIHSSPFYSVYLKKYSLKLFMGIGVSPDPTMRVALSVLFLVERDRATNEELKKLERIATHVENSLRLSLKIETSTMISEGLKRALANLSVGAILLSETGEVVFSNPVARRLFDLNEGSNFDASRPLPAAIQNKIVQTIRQASDGIISDEMTRPILVTNAGGALVTILHVIPITGSVEIRNDLPSEATMIVLAVEVDNNTPPEPAFVRDMLGLTLAEARVASLVGFGVPPTEVATRLGISSATVKTVLKRVFAKAGVAKQSELASLLSKPGLRI